ncbi:TadE family protein [Konateibacter massiliensis]|uniref:TadE family protein n=1 Tax=Konateibacter massiliensis TaxID=2002841 RepID=UPI000C15BA62|nr:TadE family protein [Konateibacter massiliensis]
MELKGSYTIEAALLMPLILGTLVALIFISFFLHDRAVIAEGTIILANRYTNEKILSNAQIKQKLEEESQNVILNKVIATKGITTDIQVENKKITVTCSGKFQFPSMYLVSSVFLKNNYTINAEKSMKRLEPVTFIRNCRILENLLGR